MPERKAWLSGECGKKREEELREEAGRIQEQEETRKQADGIRKQEQTGKNREMGCRQVTDRKGVE